MDKKYDSSHSEQKLTSKWSENDIYKFNKDSKKPLFSIDTPPPTVSGSLHIGHIFSYTQTDILARFKRMSGYNVFYPFGFDDNGLPTERFVEKKEKISAISMKRSEFIELCLKESHKVEKGFKDLWQKIGLSVDWKYTYSTISENVRRISQESFIRLLKKEYVYKKFEPALYCTSCFTSVAQAELDDVETNSTFNDISFTLKIDSNNKKTDEQVIIGTTRPELLPSCVALLYNPQDLRYKNLKNRKAIVPIFNYEVPILEDEDVEIEKGTGLVMCCTFGDKKDIEWYKKHKLPYRQSIGKNGKWTDITGPLEGLKVVEARKKILELLKQSNNLKNQKPITHAVNVHERCRREIEYLEISQWFLKILDFKDQFIKEAEKINWYPSYMKSRYLNWVENIGWDWCISRQRFYGIPFPIWYCDDCNEIIIPEIKDLPIDPQEQYPEKCNKCFSKNITADSDVMDTWNTSSLTPFICESLYNTENKLFETSSLMPMSMRPQAHDIIRTWAFYTIVKAWMHLKKIPWNEIVISGHVLAGKEKLSKSKGNEPFAPENLLQQYSADAIRFWTASGSLGQDIVFSDTQLKAGNRLITKLWNAFLFCKEHIKDTGQPDNLSIINKWIISSLENTFNSYNKHFKQNEFGLALQTLEKFFWSDFCDNYLELIKNQIFNPNLYSSNEVEATKWTLYNVGFKILQLYAPYVPFITEEIYLNIYKTNENEESIHLTQFKKLEIDTSNAKDTLIILKIVELVRKLKTELQLSLKTEIQELNLNCTDDTKKIIESNEQLIKGITQAKNINFIETDNHNIKEIAGKYNVDINLNI
jgi:valyl-tRNA synthetase